MKRNPTLLLAAFLLLAACTQVPEKQTLPATVPSAVEHGQGVTSAAQDIRKKGAEAADKLRAWYNQTAANCGTVTRPAFLCSGVMLRGTVSRQSYLPWDPSQGSITSGGVSFAWIRTDTNFTNLPLGYNNGYVFYPVLDTPPGKNSNIQVLCTFPYDGWTDIRNQQGCGTNSQYPTQSRPCNEQGINTGQQWISHFNASPDKYKAQCGWNVRDGQPDSANRFYQSIVGRGLITTSHWSSNNELRLATWAPGSGAQLPIQSFFYVAGTAGLASAQDDQRRYYQNYEQIVPVIRLTFAADKTKKASFLYRDEDQVVIGGPPGGAIDFESTPLQEGKREINVGDVRFYIEEGREGVLAIRDRVPPSLGISGRYLYRAYDSSVGPLGFVNVVPKNPVSGISYNFEYVYNQNNSQYVEVYFVDGGITIEYIGGPHYGYGTYMAPAGRKIARFRFHIDPSGTAFDNITFH